MDYKTKQRLMTGAFLGIGLILGYFMLKGVWVLLPGIVGGIVGGILASTLIQGPEETLERVSKTVKAAGITRPRETNVEYVLGQLLKLNTLIRTTHGISHSVLARVEKVIDKVERLALPLCSDYGGDELTFNVCRTGTYHLPRLLEPFLKLAPEGREEAENGIIAALDAMVKDLGDISEIFHTEGVAAARHRAKTVEMRYAPLAV